MALAALTLCGALAGALAGGTDPPKPDVAPHEWNITRSMWLADPRNASNFAWEPAMLPLRLVVVQHTAGVECYRFADCAATMRVLQRQYFDTYKYDVPYSFVVGNDGRVYEGRGWTGQAAHTRGYNRCSLGLGFTGDYQAVSGSLHPTALQFNRTLQLLEGGVRDGMLHQQYVILAAKDVQDTASPGENLYEALFQFSHFINDTHRFRDRSCEDIYAELKALDNMPAATTRTPGSR